MIIQDTRLNHHFIAVFAWNIFICRYRVVKLLSKAGTWNIEILVGATNLKVCHEFLNFIINDDGKYIIWQRPWVMLCKKVPEL